MRRPVILLGYGARGSNIEKLLGLNIPILSSWQAKDLVDNDHPNYFGCPGIYGNRTANRILHNADAILALGNRCAIWNVGYEGIRPDQALTMVDVDEHEVRKFPHAEWINRDCKEAVDTLLWTANKEWLEQCNKWRLPWVEYPAHNDNEYINSYRFTKSLEQHLRPDQVIVTDMGTALICAHQVLRLKPPQRIMTSGGLGEMGCALPAAVGASFARNKGEVLCLSTDGGMMMNLQELQTIVHHQLPVKIIVYNNSGYLMIRHTQTTGKMALSGVNPQTGVSFPDYRRVAESFGIHACEVRSWEDFERIVPSFMSRKDRGPSLLEFHMDPKQKLVPKLDPIYIDGKATSPAFDQMSP